MKDDHSEFVRSKGASSCEDYCERDVLVILPLYRNAGLVPDLFRSLISAAEDFAAIRARLLIVVDSPDDEALGKMLELELPALQAAVQVELHHNVANIGFISSVNFGFGKAIAENRDALILNSDVVVFPGAFSEMRRVAYCDHMIGFVSPRSNNATICSLPNEDGYRHRSVEASRASFEIIARYLPRYRYVPTAVGFCLYIKWLMLEEFGVFDPIYGKGYNEENDLIMRANRCGYRAALANHAFVFHIGEKSFSLTKASKSRTDARNSGILQERYPEYLRSVARETQSPEAQTERILTGLLPSANGRLTIAFDWTHVGPYHNGTFELAKAVLLAAAKNWGEIYDIVVIGTVKSTAFHGLDKIPNLSIVSYEDCGIYAAIVRVGQPFDSSVTDSLAQHAPIVAIYMLDTISLDCQYLDHGGLHEVWQYALDSMDLVVYISEYTQTQFRQRFRIAKNVVEVASLLSLDVCDYGAKDADGSRDTVLIVGNKFAHKHVDPTIEIILAQFPRKRIAVLGSSKISDPAVRLYETGSLDDQAIDQLYRDARVVLFPSHYEGFGLPIMHALARKRPVIVRRMPINGEISAALGDQPNIHQCETTEQMVRLAFTDLAWSNEPQSIGKGQGWDRVFADFEHGLKKSFDQIDYDRLVSRFERILSRTRVAQERSASLPLSLPAIRLFGTALIALGLLAIFITVASAVVMAFRDYLSLPSWEPWQYFDPANNDAHRQWAFLSRLIFWIDLEILGGRNVTPFAVMYLVQAFNTFVLVKAAMMADMRGRVRSFLVVAATICLLFSAPNLLNFPWDLQAQRALVFAAANCSFLCFAIYIQRGNRWFFLISVVSALVACSEIATGALVLPLLILFALCYRLSKKVIGLLASATIAIGLIYFFYPDGVPLSSVGHIPPTLALEYTLADLGRPFGEIAAAEMYRFFGANFMPSEVFVAAAIGLSLLVVWAGALAVVARRFLTLDFIEPAVVAISCFFAFSVLSAAAAVWETAGVAHHVASGETATVSAIFLGLWITRGRLLVGATLQAAITIGLSLVALAQLRLFQ